MIEDQADLFSRYCLEIALIKAIALAPPNRLDLSQKGPKWSPMMKRVERAAHFMVQHIEEPFDLKKVADSAKCSTRTLNEAFQNYLDTTPLKFHRQCKLEAAYAMLIRFENMGRFAKAFQEQFGCKPSEILKL
jgi:transcriptional regulator GlxA family with amidase domain